MTTFEPFRTSNTSNTSIAPLPSRAAASMLRSSGLHVALEFKDFWRSVISLAFIVLMPVMFYLAFGIALRSQAGQQLTIGEHLITQGNRSYGGVLTFALLSVALANVAISLAIRRHQGLFKRLRTTPATPGVVMGAFLINALVTAIIVVGVVTLIGTLGLGVKLDPDRLPQLCAALLLGFFCIAPVGTALSLLPPSADAAVPIVNGIFFPIAFASGAFMQLPLGHPAQEIIAYLPGKPLMDLFTCALATSGPTWDLRATLILLGWGVVGSMVSLRWFRWASEREPRGFGARKGVSADVA